MMFPGCSRLIKINLVCVGTLKEDYLRKAVEEYKKPLSRFCDYIIIELPESCPAKEKQYIMKSLKGFVIALCVEGKAVSSEGFAKALENISLYNSVVTFVIGGSEGLDPEVKTRANLRISFSEMTFPHQLMRVIFSEQLYRAFTINNNIKYHK